MRNITISAITVFAYLMLSACGVERVAIDPVGYKTVSKGEEITQEQADRIVDGQTKKDEVYLMFGAPSSILEDGHIFVYDWVRGGEGNVLGFGTGNATAHSLVVTFDGNDIVSGHQITRGNVVDEETGG